MVKVIMHGCNGHMGRVITGLAEKDEELTRLMTDIISILYFLLLQNVI